jgi:hypothetical protein
MRLKWTNYSVHSMATRYITIMLTDFLKKMRCYALSDILICHFQRRGQMIISTTTGALLQSLWNPSYHALCLIFSVASWQNCSTMYRPCTSLGTWANYHRVPLTRETDHHVRISRISFLLFITDWNILKFRIFKFHHPASLSGVIISVLLVKMSE